jgi:hypothetical protein
LWAVAGLSLQQAAAQERFVYRGICDASAAVALDKEYFVVASDEINRT